MYAASRQVQGSALLNRGEILRALEVCRKAQADVGDRAGGAGSLQRSRHVCLSLGSRGWVRPCMEQAIGEGEAPRSLSAEEWNLVDVSTISRRPGDLATARTFTARAEAMMKNQGDVVGVDGVAGGKGNLTFATSLPILPLLPAYLLVS